MQRCVCPPVKGGQQPRRKPCPYLPEAASCSSRLYGLLLDEFFAGKDEDAEIYPKRFITLRCRGHSVLKTELSLPSQFSSQIMSSRVAPWNVRTVSGLNSLEWAAPSGLRGVLLSVLRSHPLTTTRTLTQDIGKWSPCCQGSCSIVSGRCMLPDTTSLWKSKDTIMPEGRRLDRGNLDFCLPRASVSPSQVSELHDLPTNNWEKAACRRDWWYRE